MFARSQAGSLRDPFNNRCLRLGLVSCSAGGKEGRTCFPGQALFLTKQVRAGAARLLRARIFNFLGPLTNPARAEYQLLGVGDAGITSKVAEVLGRLGTKRALVVHSQDGLDEVSLSAPTEVQELRDGQVTSYTLSPEDAGLDEHLVD